MIGLRLKPHDKGAYGVNLNERALSMGLFFMVMQILRKPELMRPSMRP